MDGFSRKETTATNMKRKLLTMLLVFMVVATYIPFDRAFAADENGKRQDKQVEKKMDAAKVADKPQPKKTPADKPKSEAGGKDAGKDANKESAPSGAKGKDVKPEMPDKSAQIPAEEEKAKDGASADKAKSDPAKQAPITKGNLKSGKGIKPKALKDVDPGIDKYEAFTPTVLQRRIPYDNESCYLVNFVYPNNPDKICFWRKYSNTQKTLTLSSASSQVKASFIDDLYREIRYRIGRGGEYDIFISLDPTDNQLSISVPIKKGACIGASILESIPEIRVMRGDTTYVATGWAKSGSHDYTPLANRDVFADTRINQNGYICATSDRYGKDNDFSNMPEDKYNRVHVTIDTSDPSYHGPKNFKFGKNGSNTFTIRKGDSLRKYIKENLPDNGSYRFAYFEKPGGSDHGDPAVGLRYLAYDRPVADWAKSNNDGSIKIRPIYRSATTSIYVHELPEASSKSVKLASYVDFIPIFDSSGAEGAIPHANVKGKVCLGYSTEPNATSAMSYNTIRNNIRNHGKRHLYPVYKEKKRCVIVDYHGGKPAPGSGVSTLKTRFLVNKGGYLREDGFVEPVRDGFRNEGLNIRNYYNWNSVRHGNGAVKWPDWITYGNGSMVWSGIVDDAVVDAVWKSRSEKELTTGNFWYDISEHTDSYGRKYYTYKITSFIAKPDDSNNIVIPRMIKNVYYKGKYVDAVLKEIGYRSFRNRYLEHVKVKGYSNAGVYIPVKIGNEAFSYNCMLDDFYALANETDAEFSEIGDEAFNGNYNFDNVVVSSDEGTIGKSAFNKTALDSWSGDKVEFKGNWHTVGESAFKNAGLLYFRLNKIKGLKRIGKDAFSYTRIGEKLPGADANSVEIPASVQSIGEYAFGHSEIKKLKFQGNSVRSIEDGTFEFNKLTELTLPHGINKIGKYAFRYNALTKADISNTAVTEVAEGAFDNNQLTDAKLPSSVKTVGIRAFNGNKFGSITLGDGVEKIGVYAYGNNSKLASVSISKNLKSLHGDAFYLYPNNRPKVKVNIREKRNPNDLKDSAYHVVYPHMHVNLTFDDNGGGGGPGIIEVEKEKPIGAKFPDKKPTRTGYNFTGWDTSRKAVDTGGGNFNQTSEVTGSTTVYATWYSKRVDINFDGNGGRNVPKSTYAYYGYKLNDKYNNAYPNQIPIKEGYKFLGWAKTKDAAEPNVTKDTVINSEGPVTYYAVWQEDKVHVSFNANGGEDAPEKVEVIRNKSLGQTFPARKPIRAGHVFLGWAKSQYAARPDFYSDTPVPQDMTVYAVWRAENVEEVTVKFDVNGGNGSGTTVTVQKGTALEDKFPTMKPEKDGYTFKGWSLDQHASKADFFRSTEVNANTIVYAVWKQNTTIENVTVTFNGNGTGVTDVPPAVTIDKGSTLSEQFPKSKPKRDGYIFLGWAKSNVATTPDFFEDTEINHNMNVYAVWRDMGSIVDPVTVWFDVNGGSGSFTPVTVKRGTSLADAFPKTKPTKSGYRFKGWAKSASATAPDFNKDSIVSGDWTVYAVYEKLENVVPGDQEKPEGYVTITFDLDGKGTTDDPAKCYVKKDTEVTFEAPHVVADTGLRHTGWDKPLKGTFSVDTTIKATYEDVPDVVTPEDGDKPDGYSTVTFDLADKGTTEDKTVYYVNPNEDVMLAEPEVKAKTGHKHTGWIWEDTGNDWESGEEYQYDTDYNIVATYDDIPNVVPGTEPKPDGYSTVTFDLDGKGDTMDATTYYVKPDAEITLPKPTVKPHTGYEFKGWDKDSVGPFKEDTSIKAQYTEKDGIVDTDKEKPEGYVTVTFNLGGKATTTDKTSYYVNPDKIVDLIAPVVNEKPGYEFRGWDKQTKGQFKEETTINAKYNELSDIVTGDKKPAGYKTVLFESTGKGRATGTTRFYVNPDKDVKLNAPKITPNEGLKFTGWDKATEGKFTEDVVITAQYDKLQNVEPGDDEHPEPPNKDYVTVTFEKGEHGELDGTSRFYVKKNEDVDLTASAPKVVPEDDYKHIGWNKNIKGKFTEDTVITAQYQKLNNVIVPEDPEKPVPEGYVKVTFDKGADGEILYGKSVFHVRKDTDVSLKAKAPKAVGKKGYKFKNWDTDINALNLSNNKTITAIYEATAQHKVVYEADGNIVAVEYLDDEATPAGVPKNVPEKAGYKFIGWQKDGSGDTYLNSALSQLKITEDSKFVANYQKLETEKFLVTFENDGIISVVEKVAKGASVTTVPADPTETGKVFMGWKIEGKGPGYSKEAVKKLPIKKETAFVASFRDGTDVIPSNPDEPVKPDYVKVTFDKGDHGKSLEGTSVFQVKKDTEVDLSTDAPKVKAEGSWKFKKWDKDLKGSFDKDTKITAQFEELKDVEPADDPEPPTADYIRVTFKLGEHGSSFDGDSEFYVRKNVEVTLKGPKIKAEEGWKHTGWDKNLKGKFTADATYTATYDKLKDIEPGDTPDPPADNYAKITFSRGEHGTLEGDDSFYVRKNKDITLKGPKVTADKGWRFTNWDKKLSDVFTEDTTITAQYKEFKGEDIITPENPDEPVPVDYVKVSFEKGENGAELIGKTVFFVKKGTDVRLKAPKAVGKDGYKFKGWDKETSGTFDTDTVITAKYEQTAQHKVVYEADGKILDVEYVNNGDEPNDVPKNPEKEGYKFIGWQRDGAGDIYLKNAVEKLKITADTKFVANFKKEEADKKIVTFEVKGVIVAVEAVEKGTALTDVPADPTETGKVFMGWKVKKTGETYSKEVIKKLKVNKDVAYVASFRADENVLPGTPEDPPKPDYVKVIFDKGENGEKLKGNTVLQVKKDTEVDLTSEAPKAVGKDGWKFKAWDKPLKGRFNSETTITATYEEIGNIVVPEDPEDPPKADYVAVKFDKGEHGAELIGDTVLHVKKDTEVDLTDSAPKAIGKPGYRFAEWDRSLRGKFSAETVITAKYDVTHKYKVSYEADDVLVGMEYIANKDKPKDVPDAPEKDGYKFVGWQIDAKGTIYLKSAIEKLKISEDTKFVAKYVQLPQHPVVKHIVTFEVDGVITSVEKVENGKKPKKVPDNPEKKGYTFISWTVEKTSKTYNKAAIEGTDITEDMEFKATFKKDEVTPPGPAPTEPETPGIVTPDPDKPGEVAEGSVRITFDPTADGVLNGGDKGKKLIFDVKKSMKWEDVKNLILPNVAYKNDKMIFDKWDKEFPADGDKVAEATYTAVFKNNPGIEVPPTPDQPTPTGKVRITLDATDDGHFTGGNGDSRIAFDVDKNLKWGDIKNQIEYRKPVYKDKTKVFDKWDKAFPADTDSVAETTYTATYKEAKKFTVRYKVEGAADVTENVYLMDKPANVPADPKVAGYSFKGWQIKGEGKLYTKEAIEKFEIASDIEFVAKLEKDAVTPAKPADKKPEPAKPAAPNAPAAQKTPLIIKSSKAINLTADQQKGMAEGKYSYMELTVKNITIKVTPEEFKSMYKANNLKTYFKVATKSKKFIKSKALKKKIFKGKVYMLNMVISGTQMKKLNNVGIASVGKVKAKTKFKMMKLLGKKAKKAKGRKAKKAFSLLKKGGLYKASFDKKTKKVYFNTKGNLKKMYFGLVKIAPKKKAKKGKKVRRAR